MITKTKKMKKINLMYVSYYLVWLNLVATAMLLVLKLNNALDITLWACFSPIISLCAICGGVFVGVFFLRSVVRIGQYVDDNIITKFDL